MTEVKTQTGRFALIPEWLLDAGVSARAIHLYAILAAKYADRETLESHPSRKLLAHDLASSTDTVDRMVKELEFAGALVVTQRVVDNEFTSSSYLLVQVPIPSRTDAATPSRTDAAKNHNQSKPESRTIDLAPPTEAQAPLNATTWPDWYRDLFSIKDFKPTLGHCQEWLTKNNISEAHANTTAASLRGQWPGEGPSGRPKYKDAWATFRTWVARPPLRGRGPTRPDAGSSAEDLKASWGGQNGKSR